MATDTFSNMRLVEVHKNAVIIAPGTPLNDSIRTLSSHRESAAMRSAHYAELGDYEGKHPYQQALDEIDRAIGELKRFRAEVQSLATHTHKWGSDDYCYICGMDGRA